MGELVQGYFKERIDCDRKQYISRNKLDLALDGLEFFYTAYGEGIFPESTTAQIEGQRLHKAILEPLEWRRTKFVHRYENLYAPEAKAWVQRVERENPGCLIMSVHQSLKYDRIVERVMSHKLAGALIKNSRTELHGYAKCPRTGAWLYSRPDIITPQGWIGDLKFCRNVDEKQFNRDQFASRWYMQLAFYNFVHRLITGENLSGNCFWLAVEIKYPHRIRVHTMDTDYEKMGESSWTRAMDEILECLQKDPEMKNYEVWREKSNYAGAIRPEAWMAMSDQRFVDAIGTGG